MSEAEEIFETVRQAFMAADPGCHVVFEIMTAGNGKSYRIRFDEIDSEALWNGDEDFLNGDTEKTSFRDMMKELTDICRTDINCRGFAARHPDVMRVCETVCESGSTEELQLRLSAKGLL